MLGSNNYNLHILNDAIFILQPNNKKNIYYASNSKLHRTFHIYGA